ncbi:hypothetical protein ACFLVG_03305 [Chloroflexota bacterium]
MDTTTVIIFGSVLLLILLAITMHLFQKYIRHVRGKPFIAEIEKQLREQYPEVPRTPDLIRSMDRLFKEHQVIDKLSDAFDLIPKYVECKDKTEEDYCKEYLRKKYASGYLRYDDERAS